MTELEITLEHALDSVEMTMASVKTALDDAFHAHEAVFSARSEIHKTRREVAISSHEHEGLKRLVDDIALIKWDLDATLTRLEGLRYRINALPLSYYVGVSRP